MGESNQELALYLQIVVKTTTVNPKKPSWRILAALGITEVIQNSSWWRLHGNKPR